MSQLFLNAFIGRYHREANNIRLGSDCHSINRWKFFLVTVTLFSLACFSQTCTTGCSVCDSLRGSDRHLMSHFAATGCLSSSWFTGINKSNRIRWAWQLEMLLLFPDAFCGLFFLPPRNMRKIKPTSPKSKHYSSELEQLFAERRQYRHWRLSSEFYRLKEHVRQLTEQKHLIWWRCNNLLIGYRDFLWQLSAQYNCSTVYKCCEIPTPFIRCRNSSCQLKVSELISHNQVGEECPSVPWPSRTTL